MCLREVFKRFEFESALCAQYYKRNRRVSIYLSLIPLGLIMIPTSIVGRQECLMTYNLLSDLTEQQPCAACESEFHFCSPISRISGAGCRVPKYLPIN